MVSKQTENKWVRAAMQSKTDTVLLSFNFDLCQPFISQNESFSSDLEQTSEVKKRRKEEHKQFNKQPTVMTQGT